jgi:hypothetical protein
LKRERTAVKVNSIIDMKLIQSRIKNIIQYNENVGTGVLKNYDIVVIPRMYVLQRIKSDELPKPEIH